MRDIIYVKCIKDAIKRLLIKDEDIKNKSGVFQQTLK
jgi:hypothetical protein